MSLYASLFVCAIILFACVASSKVMEKYGLSTLLIFILVGMLFGSDGIFGIPFSDYALAERVCSIGLIFIMFYGGFGTNWRAARPVAPQAILMSTLGSLITALVTGAVCYLLTDMSWINAMLIGAVICSTDAASVFAILRTKRLNMKGGLSSLLGVESGSNDPASYMLTVVLLSIMQKDGSISLVQLLLSQVFWGLAIGGAIAAISVFILRRVSFDIKGLQPILVIGIALIAYAAPGLLNGNGYLSAYIVGLALGNNRILHKRSLVHFFDGFSWLMQLMIFFLLGLLAFPSQLPAIAPLATVIFLIVTLLARPIATLAILSWFKTPLKQQLMVAFSGLRGAASIVFAVMAMASSATLHNDLYHTVFFVCLLSVALQGSLLPWVAQKLDLVEAETSVMKTFSDYQDEITTDLLELRIGEDSVWLGKQVMDMSLPEDILIVMIQRGNSVIVPKGSTVIKANDTLVLAGHDLDIVREMEVTQPVQPELQKSGDLPS